MRDLRKKALEGGKTVSKKARNRLAAQEGGSGASSRANSTPGSRAVSRAPSRRGSDDEDNTYLSDETAGSTNSIDDFLNADDVDAPPDAWKTRLQEVMEQVIDRKRNNTEGREDSLAQYGNILLHHYAKEEVAGKVTELLQAILKSIKAESTEKEVLFALRALSITLVTNPEEVVFEVPSQALKNTIADSPSTKVKAAAIHALGAVTFFGGAGDEEIQELMSYLLEIVESDGEHIGAYDDASVVVAALEEWGALATLLDDMEDTSEEAAEAIMEQLDSSDPKVQIAAGENLALMYEKSYTEREEDEDLPSDYEDDNEDPDPRAPQMIKRYQVYSMEHQLKQKLEALSNNNNRTISKHSKKQLHSNFSDIANTINHPTRGPKHSTAIDQLTGRRYGSRLTVRISRFYSVKIDQWWKQHRLNELKRVLQSGFTIHYQENEVISDALPVKFQRY